MILRFYPSRLRGLALALILGLLPPIAKAAVSFTITPVVTSNTYTGTLTLNIAGLTNGETVNIQKYLDVNGNGTVDPGEPLVDGFKLMDGGAFVIGGITNINVPFDSNSTTGAITASLGIAPPRAFGNLAGHYIFRLSSPVGNFSPTDLPFTITNAELPQVLSGVVYSNGVAPLPYAIVAVLETSTGNGGGQWVAGCVADNSGHFQVNLKPGSYMVMPTFPGFFTDQSLAWPVALTNGMLATNNLFLTNATATISGNVYDASSSKGVGGILMPIDGGNLFAVSFTDTNGNYSLGVASGNWKVKVESDQLIQRAYVAPQGKIQVDTTTGSVANVSIALWKATALFYGTFTNTAGSPMSNIGISAQDNSNQYQAQGITDDNGNFCVGVLGGPVNWFCSPNSSDPALAGYVVSTSSQTNLGVGQAVRLNLTALPATARISGHVQDNLGNPVVGIGMIGVATINGVTFNAYIDTDGSGNYSLGAGAGLWNLFPNCCGGDGLDNFGLADLTQHSITIPPTNAVLNITLYPFGTPALSQPGRFGSMFGFGLSGAPGTNYTIQVSTNLAWTNWSTLLVTNLSGNFLYVQDPQATNNQRFYRVLRGP